MGKGSDGMKNVLLAPYTTFKIGGLADEFIEVKTNKELVAAVVQARKNNIPVYILGGGTNILIGDKGIRGHVIKNSTGEMKIKGLRGTSKNESHVRQVYVEADGGVPVNRLVRFTVDEGLKGLEMQLGLPGTVGGAVYMNSKWTKPEGYVGDAVYQARILTPAGEALVVDQKYFQFAYDTSIIQKTGDIVLSVVFALAASDKDELWKIANESIAYRRVSQPQGVKSAGCTFQNVPQAEIASRGLPPEASSAGFLVDRAGLKGSIIGGAQISPMHANFIINTGQATASDVVQLIDKAKAQVKTQFGINLVEEIVRVGDF